MNHRDELGCCGVLLAKALQCQFVFPTPLPNNLHVKFLLQSPCSRSSPVWTGKEPPQVSFTAQNVLVTGFNFLPRFFIEYLQPVDKAAAQSGPGTWGLPEWLLLSCWAGNGVWGYSLSGSLSVQGDSLLVWKGGKGQALTSPLPSIPIDQQEQLQIPILLLPLQAESKKSSLQGNCR